jgi:lipopolysaccharide/colanic/teichoic acid biosynthesis glycosyltransferase
MIALFKAKGGGGRRFYFVMKRLLDVMVSGLAMLVLFPVGCACALAVLLSSRGPAIYKARRMGKNGRPFPLYKFRSMVVGAPDWRNSDGSAFTSDRDPRVTPVGRFLRQTSLDELPQLWNVLRGDMSLVGPRPDQVDQIRYYTEAEKVKLAVKPGITGLAQISGRNAIAWETRKVLDAEYVKRQSFLLDVAILCKTIPYILKREGVNGPTATRQEV